MTRLHLLEVGLGWPPEDYLRRKLEGLASRGMRVTVAAEVSRHEARHRLQGVDLLRLPSWDEPRLAMLSGIARDALVVGLRDPRRLWRLLRAARSARLVRASLPLVRARADVVHFEWESTAAAFLPVFDAYAAPTVVSSHGGIYVRPHTGDEPVGGSYMALFGKAAAVHCVAHAVRREAARYGLDPRKARVIHTAVDTAFFSPGGVPRAARAEFRVVGVGELSWLKGYGDALQAIARLAGRGVPVIYEIVGGEPPPGSARVSDRTRLLYLIHDLGLEDRVRLAGELPQEEVRDLLRRADVLLQASLSEGLPNTVIEAMACALPVVVTDCGGLREAVTDGVQGFVCPRRSPQLLADALHSLWAEPLLAERMGRAGRERVLAEFTLPRQLDSFVQLYDAVSSAWIHRSA